MASNAVRFRALGTLAVIVVSDPGALPTALALVAAEVASCHQACSRFRDDSDLSRLNAGGGRPVDVLVDLGATAKARCADLAATAAAEAAGRGVLVSLGGDIAVAGRAPLGGWLVHVTDDASPNVGAPGQTVEVLTGGLATSGVTVRAWRRGEADLHHVIDPRTGGPAPVVRRTVSVAAGTCTDAHMASTAAIVLGEDAPGWLEERALPSRLVAPDGTVTRVAGWPPAVAGAWAGIGPGSKVAR